MRAIGVGGWRVGEYVSDAARSHTEVTALLLRPFWHAWGRAIRRRMPGAPSSSCCAGWGRRWPSRPPGRSRRTRRCSTRHSRPRCPASHSPCSPAASCRRSSGSTCSRRCAAPARSWRRWSRWRCGWGPARASSRCAGPCSSASRGVRPWRRWSASWCSSARLSSSTAPGCNASAAWRAPAPNLDRTVPHYLDEVGDGEPAENHLNVYRDQMAQMGVALPESGTLAFALWPRFLDASFRVPTF